MVWIHGGGHRTGAGWIYDGQNFARDGVVRGDASTTAWARWATSPIRR